MVPGTALWHGRGSSLARFQTGDVKAAADAFRRATRLKPDHALAHFNLGHCHRKLGDKPAANLDVDSLISMINAETMLIPRIDDAPGWERRDHAECHRGNGDGAPSAMKRRGEAEPRHPRLVGTRG